MRSFLLSVFLATATPLLSAAEPWEAFFDPFLGELRAELAEAQSSGRSGVMIMYHFEECPACARMKREVLSRPEVQAAYRKDFLVFALDIRGSQPITGFDGRSVPENAYARAQQIRGTPTFDFYDTDGELLYRHVGGIYDPDEFIALGRRVLQLRLKRKGS